MRDKRLTEAMGECWHEVDENWPLSYACKYCDEASSLPLYNNNFSTWEGFGKLWEFAQQQDWWETFAMGYDEGGVWDHLIHPDRFADAVDAFLIARKQQGES